MTWAYFVITGLWVIALIFIVAGVRDLWIAKRHWDEAEKIMRELRMVRGDSYNIDFLLTDSSGNALDLDGYSATMTVNELAQPDVDDSPVFTCVGTIVPPSTDGRIRFTPTTSDTDLEPGTYWYDLQTISNLNHVRTPAGGAFTIVQDITKTAIAVWTPDSEPASGSTVDPSGADSIVWWNWTACDSELQYYDETEQVPLTSRRCVRAVHTGASWDTVNGCPQPGVLPALKPGWQVSFYVYLSVGVINIYLRAPSTEISWGVDQTKTLAGGDAWGVYQGLANNLSSIVPTPIGSLFIGAAWYTFTFGWSATGDITLTALPEGLSPLVYAYSFDIGNMGIEMGELVPAFDLLEQYGTPASRCEIASITWEPIS